VSSHSADSGDSGVSKSQAATESQPGPLSGSSISEIQLSNTSADGIAEVHHEDDDEDAVQLESVPTVRFYF